MATNRSSAISLLRGRTITNCWLDESAFFKFLEESLQNAMPALSRAFANCKANGAPHGLCLTSTPGFLSTEEGRYMYDLKCNMTPFSELWFDPEIFSWIFQCSAGPMILLPASDKPEWTAAIRDCPGLLVSHGSSND